MNIQEKALALPVGQDTLIGILHQPLAGEPLRGVLLVVGGPQYRVGSHRQFVLLARALADAGFAVLRFDYRGMGDASGDARSFLDVERDIRSAADALFANVPSLRDMVTWGLCDAASAALLYTPTDPRVSGLVLLNPWVRTETTYARTLIRHYYLRRLTSGGFWKKLFSGRVSPAVFGDLAQHVRTIFNRSPPVKLTCEERAVARSETYSISDDAAFPARMLTCLNRFSGPVLLILSGNDLTADEFRNLVGSSRKWRKALRRASVTRRDLPGANHTFARREWRDRVAAWTLEWLRSW